MYIINHYTCIECCFCLDMCPADAIYERRDGSIWINQDHCIDCGDCIDQCQTGSIREVEDW